MIRSDYSDVLQTHFICEPRNNKKDEQFEISV